MFNINGRTLYGISKQRKLKLLCQECNKIIMEYTEDTEKSKKNTTGKPTNDQKNSRD